MVTAIAEVMQFASVYADDMSLEEAMEFYQALEQEARAMAEGIGERLDNPDEEDDD